LKSAAPAGVGLDPADGIGQAEAFDFNQDGRFDGRPALSGPVNVEVVSVGPAEWLRKDEAGAVESWLAGVDETELPEKATVTIRLESKRQ
jgi:hypothetical protein